ncbi:MAG: hypothetical protein F6K39_34845 [Okeania sp. SIO3B3]|nr:hypothetical protein [Okeania sp. SIO3B3]
MGEVQGYQTQRQGINCGYKVFLVTKNDKISIQDFFSISSQSAAIKKADQINNFLNNPEQISLKIQQHPNWFIVVWGIILIVVSVLGLLSDDLERKYRIWKIRIEISYPDHQDDKSDL